MKTLLACLSLVMGVSLARAEGDSGPKAGDKVPALKVKALVGPLADKEVDYPAERKELPTIYLLIHAEKFGRPTAQLMRGLETKITEVNDQATIVAVWIGGDAKKNEEFLPRIQMSLKFENTALAVCDTNNPVGWNINTDTHVTAVVAVAGKVVESYALVSTNGTDAKTLLDRLTKALAK